jgi:hypothetical protein
MASHRIISYHGIALEKHIILCQSIFAPLLRMLSHASHTGKEPLESSTQCKVSLLVLLFEILGDGLSTSRRSKDGAVGQFHSLLETIVTTLPLSPRPDRR